MFINNMALRDYFMKTIHYYASKKEKFIVIGENGITTIKSPKQAVSGKKEANAIAKKLNAKAWNF